MRTLKVLRVGQLLTSLETERQGVISLPNEKKKERKDVTMRKLCFVLTALLLTASAFADVTVICEQVPDTNQVLVRYVASDDANKPRAFGMDITVDSGQTIDTIVSGSPSDYFWVYPGTIDINDTTGKIDAPGTLVAPSGYQTALGGLGTGGITVEMGSLYDPCDTEHPTGPSNAEDLFKFTVSGDCNVTIAGNSARGNVVLETTEPADANYEPGCQVILPSGKCLVVGQVVGGVMISQAMYNRWVTLGEPNSWCYDCHYRGDINGDGIISTGDLLGLSGPPAIAGWNSAWSTGYNPQSDTNNDGIISTGDLLGVSDPNITQPNGWVAGWNNGCN
jgi:hypothetical protein